MRPAPLLALLTACTSTTANDDVESDTLATDTLVDDTAAPPRWPACDPTATQQVVSFVHVNDMHGEYNPDPSFPGESRVSRAVGYAMATRDENPFTLWTNGGDDYEKGSVIEELSGGRATTDIVRAMRFDVRAMGNHDYAYGEDVVLRHTQDDHATVLASNAIYTGDQQEEWHAVDRVIFDVGCVRVGLYSVNTPPWITKGHCDPMVDGNCHYLGGLVEHSYDYVVEVQALIDDLAEDVDLVVALNHLGQGSDATLMDQTTGTHLALGSHSHTFTGSPVVSGGTRLIQAGSNNTWVIRMDVSVDLETGEPTDWVYQPLLNGPDLGLAVDDQAEQDLQRLFTEYAPEIWEPVATTKYAMNARAAADLMTRAARTVGEADAALIDQEWLSAGLANGPVNVQDLFELVPHEREPPGTPSITSLWSVEMSGAHLALALADDEYTYDGPAADDLIADKTYTVVTMKRAAELPMMFMPGRPLVDVLSRELVGENWSVMHQYAVKREAACLYLDVDELRPGCTP